jgi:hypothetical protein
MFITLQRTPRERAPCSFFAALIKLLQNWPFEKVNPGTVPLAAHRGQASPSWPNNSETVVSKTSYEPDDLQHRRRGSYSAGRAGSDALGLCQ